MKKLIALALLVTLTGCLKTRSQIENGGGNSSLRTDSGGRYVSGDVKQQQRAQIDSRFYEIDRDFRQLYGKIEVLEKQISDLSAKPAATETPAVDDKKIQAIEKRMTTLEEALLSIDKKLSTLSGQKSSSLRTAKPKGPFAQGEAYFSQAKYEDAITSYDKYRKRYPRGKRYAEATLKMGLCFQRLKMPQDAKAFYKEVIQRYPKTKISKRAQKNLKSI